MVSKKVKKKIFFLLLFFIWKIRHGIGGKGGYFPLVMGPKFGPLEEGRKCAAIYYDFVVSGVVTECRNCIWLWHHTGLQAVRANVLIYI